MTYCQRRWSNVYSDTCAGSLTLIGLAINERERWEADEVVVALHVGLVGRAVTTWEPAESRAAVSRHKERCPAGPCGCSQGKAAAC